MSSGNVVGSEEEEEEEEEEEAWSSVRSASEPAAPHALLHVSGVPASDRPVIINMQRSAEREPARKPETHWNAVTLSSQSHTSN